MIRDIPQSYIIASCLSGSSYICDPPVTNTDIDIVIYVSDMVLARNELEKTGWDLCGRDYKWTDIVTFCAYRKGELNYILVDKEAVFNQWEAATLLAKKRNLLNKEDRIKLFQHIVQKEIN